MSTLTGKSPKNTYKDLLQVSNSNSGVDATLRQVEDGEGTASQLYLSSTDTKIVGTSNTNLFYVDHSADKVAVGTNAPDGLLHVFSASAGTITPSADADELVIEGSGNSGISILSGNTSDGSIFFGDDGDNDAGSISFDHNTNLLAIDSAAGAVAIRSGGNTKFSIDSTSDVTIGDTVALNTTDTGGFLRIPGMAGTPTGTAAAGLGAVCLVFDTSTNKLYASKAGGTWLASGAFT